MDRVLAYCMLQVRCHAPRNITEEGPAEGWTQAKICDFGQSTDSNKFSADVVGKFYYMTPNVTQDAIYNSKSAYVMAFGVLHVHDADGLAALRQCKQGRADPARAEQGRRRQDQLR
ncbi:hypothetical protein PC116_g28054 [Phytophthora cactorum]|uniref:Uncharacterized protein n=3 Tax=Phytophthora cactorum TaxID=29920 RepID=A0A8T1A9K5_9STRA|nr:hypothetical protein Pcac1_g20367 [Phytophthora cactorum]KAG2768564.1 hypothetical protein Pcac1_g20358 [Phytophthora cactorum]KAG2790290.1 hypothetical protein PC112_g24401 [Phytophthora cactorum]KAG2876354.1 hypothetical protein PC117_g27262 [Phytophthora cactorum]KAG2967578.1 hypothetical protein PC120_g26944 [Phytophthora cactorum]